MYFGGVSCMSLTTSCPLLLASRTILTSRLPLIPEIDVLMMTGHTIILHVTSIVLERMPYIRRNLA